MLIPELLRESAKKFPDKVAVKDQKKQFSFKELDMFSDNFSAILMDKGVKPGDRAVIFLDNCCEYLVAYFGILKSGGVIVALNGQLVVRELTVLLNDCTPQVIVTDKKHAKVVEAAVVSGANKIEILFVDNLDFNKDRRLSAVDCVKNSGDTAMIVYTSGTTGKPKGVILSHKNIIANADSIIKYLSLTERDKIMVVLPFYYSYGHSLLTTHIKVGGTLVIDTRFLYPNVILDHMVKEEVTGFAGVPSHFSILLRKSNLRKYNFSQLRYVTQAGGAMPPALIDEFCNIFPEVNFFVMYGQTEATARLSYLEPKYLKAKAGSIGRAIPGVELKILNESGDQVTVGEVGEIVATGQNIMPGYWQDPEETGRVLKPQGLFTGDLALVDQDGFLYLISRKKEMIKSGANRISPLEIDAVIAQMPEVVECAAVGIPDGILGEAICVFIVGDVEEQDILKHCKQNLAIYKIPKIIKFVDVLPKTASGKVKREELKGQMMEEKKI